MRNILRGLAILLPRQEAIAEGHADNPLVLPCGAVPGVVRFIVWVGFLIACFSGCQRQEEMAPLPNPIDVQRSIIALLAESRELKATLIPMAPSGVAPVTRVVSDRMAISELADGVKVTSVFRSEIPACSFLVEVEPLKQRGFYIFGELNTVFFYPDFHLSRNLRRAYSSGFCADVAPSFDGLLANCVGGTRTSWYLQVIEEQK